GRPCDAGAIKLASNENPLGPSPRAAAAAAAAIAEVNRYPDGASLMLRRRLAALHRVDERQIVIGSGSSELIELLGHVFCDEGDEVLAPAHAFISYRLQAEGHRRPFREAPLAAGLQQRAELVLQAISPRTKLIFIANPNNPTGAYMTSGELARLIADA